MGRSLSSFIEETLAEIRKGVDGAREKGLVIAPSRTNFPDGERQGNPVSIKFEVEVASDKSGDVGVTVLGLADIKGNAAHRSGHRLSFELPVYFWAEWKEND